MTGSTKTEEDPTVIRSLSPRVTILSIPFWRFDTFPIGGRATLVELKSGSLAVFSPVPLTDTVKKEIGDRTVSYIIAPDIEHHLYLSQWHDHYKTAKTIAPDGLQKKRDSAGDKYGTQFKFDYVFTAQNKETLSLGPEFDDEFQYEYVDVHPNREIVFNYKPERTLIQADLFFNLPAIEQFSKSSKKGGFLSRCFSSWGSATDNSLVQKSLIYYGFSGKGSQSFNKSISNISKWDFDRIIPCHGEVIDNNGKSIFQKLMSWNLPEAPSAPKENL